MIAFRNLCVLKPRRPQFVKSYLAYSLVPEKNVRRFHIRLYAGY